MHPPIYSMTRTAGLRTHKQGWKDRSLYRPRHTPSAVINFSEEEREAQNAALIEAMTARLNPANGQQALNKLVDREARISVEGDTDLNHDNLEDPA